MKKTSVILTFWAVLTLLLGVGIARGEDPRHEIINQMNGEFWHLVSEENDSKKALVYKLFIVRGIYHGAAFCEKTTEDPFYRGATFSHLVDALDQFYTDYRNRKVDLGAALMIISMELRGESKENIDAMLRHARGLYSGETKTKDHTNIKK